MGRVRKALATALAVGTLGLAGRPAHADERTEARHEFRAGMAAIAEGQYEAGIQHLEAAYQASPHPDVLYNLGLAHMYAGHTQLAVRYLERYRASAAPEQVADVDAILVGLRAGAERPREAGEPPPAAPTPASTPPPKPVPPAAAASRAYDEQLVSAARYPVAPLDAPYSSAIITAHDIRMTGLTNVTDLLRRVAGVDVSAVNPGHAEVAIRGLNSRTSNKVLLLVDGRSRRLDFLGASWFNQLGISVEDIERIEVIRGPASQLYGADAFSGVINIITRAPGEGRPFVLGGYGSDGRVRAAGSFNGREDKLAYHFGAGHDEAQNSVREVGRNRVDVASYGDPNLAYARTWANGELRYTPRPRLEATVGGSVSYAKTNTVQGLSRLLQVSAPNNQEANFYAAVTTPIGVRVSSYWDGVRGDAGASSYSPGQVALPGLGLRQDVGDLDVSWSRRFTLLVPQHVTVGGGYRFKYTDWAWFDGAHRQHHFAAYLSDVIELVNPLALHLGARVDRHPLLDRVQFSPRAALVYRFLQGHALRASVGRAFRGPTFLESYLVLPTATPERGVAGLGVGNRGLDPERIVSYELGYASQPSDYVSLEANVYYNSVKDAILFTDVTRFSLQDFAGENPLAAYDPITQAFPISSLSFRNERAAFDQVGGELGARAYPVSGLDVYANYGLHDTTPHDRAGIDPVRARQRPTSLNKINAGVQYRAPFGLDASIDVSWLSRQVWVEQVVDIAQNGVRFQAFSQPSFVMLNARVGVRLWQERVELGLVGTNLAFQERRQHPFGQPIDTRILGTSKLRF